LALEEFDPLDHSRIADDVGAIVILSADYREFAPEFGRETVGRLSLERLRYGALLHRQTGLPILIAGGRLANSRYSLAEVMRKTLVEEFAVPVRWVEDQSLSTLGHAREVPRILAADGIKKFLLVTHSWHMRRAMKVFRLYDQDIVAAPTCPTQPPTPIITDFRPGPRWLVDSYFAIYERLAYLNYSLRNGLKAEQSLVPGDLQKRLGDIADEGGALAIEAQKVDGETSLGSSSQSLGKTS
jgi:uncharacterized SAM-binding protein YcdF (DUF218 family)